MSQHRTVTDMVFLTPPLLSAAEELWEHDARIGALSALAEQLRDADSPSQQLAARYHDDLEALQAHLKSIIHALKDVQRVAWFAVDDYRRPLLDLGSQAVRKLEWTMYLSLRPERFSEAVQGIRSWMVETAVALEDIAEAFSHYPPPAPPDAPPDRTQERSQVVVQEKMKRSWRDVQRDLMGKYNAAEAFTSYKALGAELDCSPATIHKAMHPKQAALDQLAEAERTEAASSARRLRGWVARHSKQKKPRASSLNEVVLDNVKQTREIDPAREAEGADSDIEFARLLQEEHLKPEHRASLNELDEKGRERFLVGLRKDPDNYDRLLGRTP